MPKTSTIATTTSTTDRNAARTSAPTLLGEEPGFIFRWEIPVPRVTPWTGAAIFRHALTVDRSNSVLVHARDL